MLKIGDFSQLGQVSVRTLRLYDELGLLKPAQIDKFTDYRYYSVEQLPRLNRILTLKDLGFSLEQIKRLIDDNLPAEQLRGMLLMKQAEMERELQEGAARLGRVEARLRQIEQEGVVPKYDVVIKRVEPQRVAGIRQVIPSLEVMTNYRCAMYENLYAGLGRHHLLPQAPELALYHMREYREQDIDMEAAVVLNKVGIKGTAALAGDGIVVRELPGAENMASVIHHGRMIDLIQAIVAVLRWIGTNHYTSAGAFREVHLFGREIEDPKPNFDSVVLEIQLPVEEA